jgi:hypothetical protein
MGIAQYYDLPVLSVRNALLHQVLANASLVPHIFRPDGSADRNNAGGVDLRHVRFEMEVVNRRLMRDSFPSRVTA